jgi:hypothetical protein
MSRDIDSSLAAEFRKPGLTPILLAEIDVASEVVRAWTGPGDLTWNGNVFKGVGTFGGIGKLTETTDNTASGMALSLSGIPADLVEISLAEIRQGKTATVYLACLDARNRLVGQPLAVAAQLTDVPSLSDDGQTATISLSCEPRSIDQGRARVRRYTTQDQQLDDPTDRGFEYVPPLQSAQILWGGAGLSI